MDFGRWEGLPWSAVPRAELDAWAADLMHARPHGGESVAMLLARTRRALARCRAAPATPSPSPTPARSAPRSSPPAATPTPGGASIGFGETIALDPGRCPPLTR